MFGIDESLKLLKFDQVGFEKNLPKKTDTRLK